jgi:hypothetical protein
LYFLLAIIGPFVSVLGVVSIDLAGGVTGGKASFVAIVGSASFSSASLK